MRKSIHTSTNPSIQFNTQLRISRNIFSVDQNHTKNPLELLVSVSSGKFYKGKGNYFIEDNERNLNRQNRDTINKSLPANSVIENLSQLHATTEVIKTAVLSLPLLTLPTTTQPFSKQSE